MVETDQTLKGFQLSEKEKQILSEETNEWLTFVESQKTEGKLHEGKWYDGQLRSLSLK